MKKLYYALLIVIAMIVLPSYSAVSKIKTISYNGRTIYQGYVLSKQPYGEGKLYVVKPGASNIEDGNHDLLSGNFSNHTVTGATLKLISGVTFLGTVQFEPTLESVKYILSDGAFKFDGVDYDIPIENQMTIERKIYDNFSVTPSAISRQVSLDFSKDYICKIIPVEVIKKYVNVDTITASTNYSYFLYNGNSQRSDTTILDLGGSAEASYVNKDKNCTFDIIKSNGDSLHVNINKYIFGSVPEEERIKNTLSDGVIYFDKQNEYNKPLEYAIFSVGSDDGKTHYCPDDRIEIDMNDDILQRYKKCLYHHDVAKSLYPEMPFTEKNVRIEYSDGSRFVGKIYTKYAKFSNVAAVAGLNSLKKDSLCYEGLLTRSDGTQQVYMLGRTLEYVENVNAVYDIEQAKKDSILRAEREAAEQAARAEELKKREPLYNKYGKKYVDAILDDHKVLIGTPEGLISNEMNSYLIRKELSSALISESMSTRIYSANISFFTSLYLYVDVKSGRVTSIVSRY